MMPLRSLYSGPFRGFVTNRNFLLNYLRRQEAVEMWIEGENRVVGHSLQELVQSFHPGLHKLLRKTIHHTLHHKLLWQRLHKKTRMRRSKEEIRAGRFSRVFLHKKWDKATFYLRG